MSIDIARASLRELGEITPDSILVGEIDDKLVNLPSYRDLYHRWEKQQWSTQDLDFSADREQWAGVPEENRPIFIAGFVIFFQGEVSVTNTLIPYMLAVPTEEQRFFLSTQLVDEVRHAIFFDKFFREALQISGPDVEATLTQIRPLLQPGPRKILLEGLVEMGQRIASDTKNLDYLVEGITLYHIITEGTLALAGQRNMLNRNKRLGWYPGFQQGFTAIARDESRHVLFGVRFLRDMVQQDRHYADVIRETIARWLPDVQNTMQQPEATRQVLLNVFGEDPDDIINFGMNSLRKKLKVIGVEHNF
ncbi:MAG TPA: ribonucleotide-diphosphate reductase subunit beta [Ktedonobacteraceae bacterium]|nr:ribonucleotide-diphosphate reductase subunit beta [Ktedonobacteraceae bacterium]